MTFAFMAINPSHPPRSDPLGTKAGLAFCLPAQAARPESVNELQCVLRFMGIMFLHQPKNIPNAKPHDLCDPNSPCCASAANCGLAGWGHRLWQVVPFVVFLVLRECNLGSTGSKGRTIQIPSAGWACLLAVVSLSR